jgi:hypothetical protein
LYKCLYDPCLFIKTNICFTGLKEKNKFFTNLLPQLEELIKECENIIKCHQALIEKYRSKFGTCSAQQVVERKRKHNAKKEKQRQAKKKQSAIEPVIVDINGSSSDEDSE